MVSCYLFEELSIVFNKLLTVFNLVLNIAYEDTTFQNSLVEEDNIYLSELLVFNYNTNFWENNSMNLKKKHDFSNIILKICPVQKCYLANN